MLHLPPITTALAPLCQASSAMLPDATALEQRIRAKAMRRNQPED